METTTPTINPIRRHFTLDETAGVKVCGRVTIAFWYEPDGELTLEIKNPADLSRVWCAAETILRVCRSSATVTADRMEGAK